MNEGLAAWSRVLREFNILSARHEEELTRLLETLSLREEAFSLNEPLLRNNIAFKAMVLRHGALPFAANFLRSSFKKDLNDWVVTFSDFSSELLAKAKLVFNRKVSVYEEGRLDTTLSYSKVLVDGAESLDGIVKGLMRCSAGVDFFVPASMGYVSAEEAKVDEALAQALGFSGVLDTYFWQFETQGILSEALDLLQRAVMGLRELAQIVQTDREKLEPLHDDIQWVLASLQEVRLMSSSRYQTLAGYEQWRMRLTTGLKASLLGLERIMLPILSWVKPEEDTGATKIPASLGRRVSYDLFAAGTSFEQAKDASFDLLAYLEKRDVRPCDLIDAELTKIHPALRSKTLAYLKDEPNELLSIPSTQKGMVLKKAQSLASALDARKAQIKSVLLVLLALGFGGCGFKDLPKSNDPTPRPEIPFRG